MLILAMQQTTESLVIFTEIPANNGLLGIITLNRPNALNAISVQMVIDISDQLYAWAKHPDINAVIIQSSSERAFSAGGDLRQMYAASSVDITQYAPFFRHEYKLNQLIHNYPKPYIALLDGIAMGGGLGLSVHGSHVVAAENLKLAMPEVGIGLYPDVGASFFLAHCPNFTGMYLGLTGSIINVHDAIYIGLVNNFVPRNNFPALINKLSQQDLRINPIASINKIIAEFSLPSTNSQLATHIDIIKSCFSQPDVKQIINALNTNASTWALAQVAIMQTKSPTSLKVTHKAMTLGAKQDITACLEMELNLSLQLIQRHDIYEGIRATLIDKTHDPKWQPATLDAVPHSLIAEMFEIKCKL